MSFTMPRTFPAVLGLAAIASAVAVPSPFSNITNTTSSTKHSVQIPLDSYFNNHGFGEVPGEASFDQLNNSYPAAYLPAGGSYTSTKTGISYLFPGYQGPAASDNVIMAGQAIDIPADSYFSVQMLIAADLESTAGNLTFTYTDNSSSIAEVRSEPYFNFLTIYKGEIILPSYFTDNDTNFNTTHMFEYIGALDPSKSLASITLPDTTNTSSGSRLHVFALSLYKGAGIEVQYVRPTQKSSGERIQTVEVVINNAGSEWISGEGVEVSIVAPGIMTMETATIKRLRPGDQKKVNIGVIGCGNVTGDVILSGSMNTTYSFDYTSFGLEEYTSELDSLTNHESPEWFNDAKYGIFIHWGPYSVPGWGNSTPYEVYAEWYWWYMTHEAGDTKAHVQAYDLETYGPYVVYDDFFANFTASEFDAKEWVDLFDEAGAQYFVFTTKHHDGFAMFDTEETTHRNALHYGPKRDILKELFDAAKTYQPHLHKGTYFSLPEWFNPDFGPYGFAQSPGNASTSWPGIIARNPFTGEDEPYTGRTNISDFIADLMVPQMEILAYEYGTEIMWCDCGAANGTAEFAAAWYNAASKDGREVTMNSRCGIPQGSDFDTPEYTTFSSVSERKWESNQGMDPYSYGYNRATPASLYMNASTIVSSLIDMISKNGNLLLDVGPMPNGTIDATEVLHLQQAGKWIKANAEAIFNTTYYFITPETDDIRFTQTADAFYIHSLTKPSGPLVVDVPLPILEGDKITMIGAGNGTELEWESSGSGIIIDVPDALADAGEYCWVMKVEY